MHEGLDVIQGFTRVGRAFAGVVVVELVGSVADTGITGGAECEFGVVWGCLLPRGRYSVFDEIGLFADGGHG
jgi:hypothetical protein